VSDPIRLFCGYDAREAVGFHVFSQSVLERTSVPVSITPLTDAMKRDGSNAFTYSRFLIPWLCGFKGRALFVDGADMLLREDLVYLWDMYDPRMACQVVKHEYKTSARRKYVGTEMEADNRDYPRKNWSSVILWNCGHYLNRCLTPEFIDMLDGAYLHRFGWLDPERAIPAAEGLEKLGDRIGDRLGALPGRWNVLIGEGDMPKDVALAHWTLGIPGIEHYSNAPLADEWRQTYDRMVRGPVEVRELYGTWQLDRERVEA